MDPHLSGNTPRCTRQAQQKRREHPVHHRAFAAVQECAGEVIEGPLAALLFTAVAFQPRLVVVRPPRTAMVALTVGTLEWALFPQQRMAIRLTCCGAEEVVEMLHNRQGCAAPLITKSVKNRIGDFQLAI